MGSSSSRIKRSYSFKDSDPGAPASPPALTEKELETKRRYEEWKARKNQQPKAEGNVEGYRRRLSCIEEIEVANRKTRDCVII